MADRDDRPRRAGKRSYVVPKLDADYVDPASGRTLQVARFLKQLENEAAYRRRLRRERGEG